MKKNVSKVQQYMSGNLVHATCQLRERVNDVLINFFCINQYKWHFLVKQSNNYKTPKHFIKKGKIYYTRYICTT